MSLLIIFSFTTADIEITKKERDDAISYCKETKMSLEKEIAGLSENQLNWKPADSVWSAADCLEHIALSEKNLFDWAMSTLKVEANPAKRSELKINDETIKKMLTNRSFKAKAREGFIPTRQFGNTAGSLKDFTEKREGLIKYINETKDDLRNHFAETPIGLVDTYQLLLFLSAHTLRHTLQIAELKSHPGFPKQ